MDSNAQSEGNYSVYFFYKHENCTDISWDFPCSHCLMKISDFVVGFWISALTCIFIINITITNYITKKLFSVITWDCSVLRERCQLVNASRFPGQWAGYEHPDSAIGRTCMRLRPLAMPGREHLRAEDLGRSDGCRHGTRHILVNDSVQEVEVRTRDRRSPVEDWQEGALSVQLGIRFRIKSMWIRF